MTASHATVAALSGDAARRLAQPVPSLAGQDVIMGAYLTSQPDPQTKSALPAVPGNGVFRWAHSVTRLGLTAVLLHDGIPPDALTELTHTASTTAAHGALHSIAVRTGPFTPNDERFLLARMALEAMDCRAVFLTDVTDLQCGRNPFPLVHRRHIRDYLDIESLRRPRTGWTPRALWRQAHTVARRHHFRLFAGREPGTIGDNPWMVRQFGKIYGGLTHHLASRPVLNCGILGGLRSDVLSLLYTMGEEMRAAGQVHTPSDMVIFNRILHERMALDVLAGGIINSPWKEYHTQGQWYFFHK